MKSINFNTNRNTAFENFCKKGNKNRKIAAVLFGLAGLAAPTAYVAANLGSVQAATANTTFNVNVKESLAVSITAPSEYARGDAGVFLRNQVNLSVSTNNANGFTASMYSQNSTNLTNMVTSTETIPTLSSYSTRSSFPANRWGYSLGDGYIEGETKTYGETVAGNNSSRYYPLTTSTTTPIKILTGTDTGEQQIYFGAKSDLTKASGTYTGTVIISVVTDVIDSNNPITPSNPAQPNNTNEVAAYTGAPTGSTSSGSTTYTYRRTSGGATTTTTQVSEGNNVSAYQGYTPPQGVIENTLSNVYDGGSPLASALAATSASAAAAGMFFFILAKRKDDDDQEEEEQQIQY